MTATAQVERLPPIKVIAVVTFAACCPMAPAPVPAPEVTPPAESIATAPPPTTAPNPIETGDPLVALVQPRIPNFTLLSVSRFPPAVGRMVLPQTGVEARYRATDDSGLRIELLIDRSPEPLTTSGPAKRLNIRGQNAIQTERADQVWVGWRNGQWLFNVWIRPSREGALGPARRRAREVAEAISEWADPYVAGTLSADEQARRRADVQTALSNGTR